MVLIDGGSDNNINLISAIHQCLEVVDDPRKIVMDIAVCSNKPDESDDHTKNAARNFHDAKSLKKKENGTNAISW